MKRFSNTVSVMVPVPSATAFMAVNWACMSVGKPGCGWVWMSTASGRRPSMLTSIQSGPTPTLAPAVRSLPSTASSRLASVSRTRTRPPVIAAATR